MDSGLSQSEAFPPLSPDHSDVAFEHDIMLPIKGKCMWTLEALRSDLWLWVLGLSCGDQCSVVDRKAGLSFRNTVSISKGKNTFTSFLLLSLLRPNSLCAATTFRLRRSRVVVFELKPPRLLAGGIESAVIPLGHSSTPGSRHIQRNTVTSIFFSVSYSYSITTMFNLCICAVLHSKNYVIART